MVQNKDKKVSFARILEYFYSFRNKIYTYYHVKTSKQTLFYVPKHGNNMLFNVIDRVYIFSGAMMIAFLSNLLPTNWIHQG